uniref:Uncharacterized protein n=1 Tax=Homo sapiens TaxID=9606 RepID=Q71MM4_HUMAN|nr:unknown [Homo sapiens]
MAPLHSSLGDRARLRLPILKKKKKKKKKCKDVIMWQGVRVKKKTRTSFPLLSQLTSRTVITLKSRGQRNGLQTASSGAKLKRKIPLLSLLF